MRSREHSCRLIGHARRWPGARPLREQPILPRQQGGESVGPCWSQPQQLITHRKTRAAVGTRALRGLEPLIQVSRLGILGIGASGLCSASGRESGRDRPRTSSPAFAILNDIFERAFFQSVVVPGSRFGLTRYSANVASSQIRLLRRQRQSSP